MGVYRSYESDGGSGMTSLRSRLIKIAKNTSQYRTTNEVLKAFSYAIQIDIDTVLVNGLGDLRDMGFSNNEISKVKRMIKRRL